MPGVGTTHHVKLGGHYYLVRPGSYMKKAAPTFGARFVTGDPDFNSLSMWQHWAQRCFVGGIDQKEFVDDAMYHEGIGVDTTQHEEVRLARDLARGGGSNWTISSGSANATAGFKAIVYNNILYVATLSQAGTISHLWKYDPSTDGWVRITSLDASSLVIRSVGTFDGKLWLGGLTTGGVTRLVYGSGALASWTTLAPPGGVTGHVWALKAFQRKLYVAYDTQVWRIKEDLTFDGNTVFYKANQNSDSNVIVNFEVHLGFLYFISLNGHIHRTDGNSTFDIWSWDGQTQGVALKSFDGRLFVLTFEYTNTASAGWGVLYQMSGSAVTQLKRWGDPGLATLIGGLTVYDRRLWYGGSNNLGMGNLRAGFGVAVYDPIEDAHSMFASNGDTVTYVRGVTPYTNYIVDDQIFFQGKLFAFVRGHGAFFTTYQFMDHEKNLSRFDRTSNGADTSGTNGGWLTTSMYDAGLPGVKKLWRKIVADVTIPASGCSVTIEYSVNNGTSWTSAGVITTVAGRARYEFFLNNVISTSVKLRITLRSTDATKTPVFYGFVVSYIPVPEPNWLWQFTIVLSEKQVLLDNTEATVDTEAEIAFLNGVYRNKVLVDYTDAEGVSWADDGPGVLVYDLSMSLRDLNQPLEGEVNVTLLEAVETY